MNYRRKRPKIHGTAFIAGNSKIIGDVEIGEKSSIWFGAVIRGDVNRIKIGRLSNVQDNCVMHGTYQNSTSIGDGVSVGHNAIVHGASVKSNCIIGMGAIILSGAVIGENSIVAAGAVVKENEKIPPGSLVAGVPAKVKREVTEDDINKIKENAIEYDILRKRYLNYGSS